MMSVKQTNSLFIIGLLICVSHFKVAQASEKKQCFPDAQLAYDYLIAQEKQKASKEKLASQQDNVISGRSTININTAGEAQLVSLKGIGSKKAQAIISYRSTMGRFNRIDDLENVSGIGKKTVNINRSRLTIQD